MLKGHIVLVMIVAIDAAISTVGRVGMALVAGKSAVLSRTNGEITVVGKVHRGPVWIGGMAVCAGSGITSVVMNRISGCFIFCFVAGIAVARNSGTIAVGMTLGTTNICMSQGKREISCMQEIHWTPSRIGCMALLTIRRKTSPDMNRISSRFEVIFMAAITFSGCTCEIIIDMALTAGYIGMT